MDVLNRTRGAWAAGAAGLLLLGSCLLPQDLGSGATGDLGQGSLRLSEVSSTNDGAWTDDAGETPDWIELVNDGPEDVDLAGWALGDKADPAKAWSFPHRILAPGERLVVAASGQNLRPADGLLHTDFTLGSGGCLVTLWHDGVLADRAVVPALTSSQSWGRIGGRWVINDPVSPGAPNLEGISEPGFSSPGGLFTKASVSLTFSGRGQVLYTLDGSTPTLEGASPAGTAQIWDGHPLTLADPDLNDTLPGGSVVTARLVLDGRTGPVARRSYLFYPEGSQGVGDLGVMSLSGEPTELVSGKTGVWFDPNPWNNDDSDLIEQDLGLLMRNTDLYDGTEVQTHFDWFEGANKGPAFQAEAGATLAGAYSRNLSQKSLALLARSSYGTKAFDHAFFPGLTNDRGRALTSFEGLVIRNSGNDGVDQWNGTMLRDAIMTGLTDSLDIDHQAYRPAVVFVNGRYWGFYQLREKVHLPFLTAHHPAIAQTPLDFIENYGDAHSGDLDNFNALQDYLANHSGADQTVYDKIASWIDLDEFTDYEIAQIYFGNTDWPGNNIKFWRPRTTEGRWRWVLYDTDFGFGWATQPDHDTLAFATAATGSGWPNPDYSTLLLRRLLENSGYKQKFTARFLALLANQFSVTKVHQAIDAKAAEVRTEMMERHWPRWNADVGSRWDQSIQAMKDWVTARNAFWAEVLPGYFVHSDPVRHDGTGLVAEYHQWSNSLTDAVFEEAPWGTATGQVINWNKDSDGEMAPDFGVDNIAVRWKGRLRASLDGAQRLILSGDDGVRLWLNGQKIIDGWRDQGVTPYQASVTLEAGQFYDLQVEYYQGGGGAAVYLEWAQGGFREIVPLSQLYPPAP